MDNTFFELGWFWTTLVLMIIGYLFGTLLFSRIYISVFKKGKLEYVDRRTKQIKPITTFGTSQTAYMFGLQYGIIQFLLDFGKPLIFWFFVVRPLVLFTTFSAAIPAFALVAVVLGNNYPVWWKFNGGEGVAVGVGILFCFNWVAGVIGFTIWLLSVLLTKNQVFSTFMGVNFGTIVSLLPIYGIVGIPSFVSYDWTLWITMISVWAIILFSHSNYYIDWIRSIRKDRWGER